MSDQFAAEDDHGFDFRENQMRDSQDWIPNKALDPTAGSVSILMFTDFMTSLSFLKRAYPAVGQLDR